MHMNNLKSFAHGVVSLSAHEVQKLVEIMNEEYGIEAAAENVNILNSGDASISRQERRKREREAKKREAKERQKRG